MNEEIISTESAGVPNAFNLNFRDPHAPDFAKLERGARASRRSTEQVMRAAAKGVKLAKLDGLSIDRKGLPYSAPVVGRVAGEAQRDKSAAMKKASI